MATLVVEWKSGGPKLTVAVAAHSADPVRPPGALEFDALVDTGYDLSMVPAAKVNALQLARVRDGSSISPLGRCGTSIHKGSLWHQTEALSGEAEFSVENRDWGLLGQNVLLGHTVEQTGPEAGKLGIADAAGNPVVVTGDARLSGPKVTLGIGPAIAKGGQKPHCVEWRCILDTGAGRGFIAPLVAKELKLKQSGTRTVRNSDFEREVPECRVSIWYGGICVLPDYPVGVLQPNGSPVLLGQDFLTWCHFTQDGLSGTVVLRF